MANKRTNGKLIDKKYILRKAKNGRKREKHASTALYVREKMLLQKKANEFAKTLGYERMSVSAYINLKLMLPGND